MKNIITLHFDQEYIIDSLSFRNLGKGDFQIKFFDKDGNLIYTHFQENQAKISNNILNWETIINFSNYSAPIKSKLNNLELKDLPVNLSNKLYERIYKLFQGKRYIKLNDIKSLLNKNKNYYSHLSNCIEAISKIFLELNRDNKIYLYLDWNEYKGYPWHQQIINQENKIIEKENYSVLDFEICRKHRQLSRPIFITDKKITDIPSYVDEIIVFFKINTPKWHEEFIKHSNSQDIPLTSKKRHSSKNEIYENRKNGKSKWIKDVENGILFVK